MNIFYSVQINYEQVSAHLLSGVVVWGGGSKLLASFWLLSLENFLDVAFELLPWFGLNIW